MSEQKIKMYKKQNNAEIIGKITFHQQIYQAKEGGDTIDKDNKKVLIIHTGGTIGMFKNQNGSYQPEKDKFKAFLENYPYFSDENQTYFLGCDGFTITPETIFKKKIWYKYFEMDHLIDSANMSISKHNTILKLIEENYELYDSFILLHGTDTMSFTASALSFMIENLKKTIILTGAQVPIGESRNDSINNLLCALTIAGHYNIPEILVVFDNTILRGNRTTKTSVSSFNSFKSPNYYPIGSLGLKITIKWELILPCKFTEPTKFTPLKQEVGLIKLTPFGFHVVPKNKYIVIQSYGVGNIPTEGPFHDWVVENSKKPEDQQVVIVNISQVYQSVILNIYATGEEAKKLRLIPGNDMTCEAAVAKLSYLATKNMNIKDIQTLMQKNLRGELTEEEDRTVQHKENYVINCITILEKDFTNETENFQNILRNVVFPKLIQEGSSKQALARWADFGLDVNFIFSDGKNLLHHFCQNKVFCEDSIVYLKFLLEKGINTKLIDRSGNSALFYAIENLQLQLQYQKRESIISSIKQAGGKLQVSSERIFKAIGKEQMDLLEILLQNGDTFEYLNFENRNPLVYSIVQGKPKLIQFFINNTELMDEPHCKVKDIYGKDLSFYKRIFKIHIQ